MDDESGWSEVLVAGWGPLVRDAVVARVIGAFADRPGILAATAIDPDDADPGWVEDVHVAVVAAIRAETGADVEQLGSQAAWATYDDVWVELGRRPARDEALTPVPEARIGQVLALLAELPDEAVLHAGGVRWPGSPPTPVVVDGRARVHLPGVFRWLATEDGAPESHRALARALIAVVRGDPLLD